jgi:hypothetical protein
MGPGRLDAKPDRLSAAVKLGFGFILQRVTFTSTSFSAPHVSSKLLIILRNAGENSNCLPFLYCEDVCPSGRARLSLVSYVWSKTITFHKKTMWTAVSAAFKCLFLALCGYFSFALSVKKCEQFFTSCNRTSLHLLSLSVPLISTCTNFACVCVTCHHIVLLPFTSSYFSVLNTQIFLFVSCLFCPFCSSFILSLCSVIFFLLISVPVATRCALLFCGPRIRKFIRSNWNVLRVLISLCWRNATKGKYQLCASV